MFRFKIHKKSQPQDSQLGGCSPSDLCFVGTWQLEIFLKSSHRRCFSGSDATNTTFHNIQPSLRQSFRFQHSSKHSFLWRHVVSTTGSLFTAPRWRPDSRKKGGGTALRAGSVPDFRPRNQGIFANRFEKMWRWWKKWTKTISLHSFWGGCRAHNLSLKQQGSHNGNTTCLVIVEIKR